MLFPEDVGRNSKISWNGFHPAQPVWRNRWLRHGVNVKLKSMRQLDGEMSNANRNATAIDMRESALRVFHKWYINDHAVHIRHDGNWLQRNVSNALRFGAADDAAMKLPQTDGRGTSRLQSCAQNTVNLLSLSIQRDYIDWRSCISDFYGR